MQILHVTARDGWGGNLTLLPGYTMMVFDPDERYLVEKVIKGFMDMYPTAERDYFYEKLKEIYNTVRVTHTKEELQ